MNLRTIAAILVFGASTFAVSAQQQDADTSFVAKSHYAGVFVGRSELILGSEDLRVGGGLFYAYGRPERRLRLRNIYAQQVAEVYIDRTHSQGTNGDPSNDAYAIGGLAYARYRFKSVYFDFGLGLQVQNRATTDLPSYINSTPMGGFGFVFNSHQHDYFAGLRWLHISNARTKSKNPGQNEIFLQFGIRF